MAGISGTLRKTLQVCFTAFLGCGCESVHSVNSNPEPAVSGSEKFIHQQRGERKNPGKPWWTAFRDPGLSELIETALEDNPELSAVGRRIDQANARYRQAGATLFPQVDGGGEIGRRWERDGGRNDGSTLGFLFDWEIDIWGRLRSAREARGREVEVSYEDWLGSRLLLSGAVAETWFELLEQHGQYALVRDQIESNQILLDLTELRFGQAQASSVDVLQAKVQLESNQVRVPEIESRMETLELALTTLTGRAPGSRKRVRGELKPPPPLPSAGVPSDLVSERPDLRAIRARIVALDYEVGEAIADRLPRFTIGGAVSGAGSPGLESLVGEAVASAIGPVFDAGGRKAEVERRRARLAEELDIFTAAFLEAVREVETALIRERKQTERTARQESQLVTARRLLVESRNRYSAGLTDYLPVLTAVATVQNLERDLLTSRRALLSFRVALYRAIGGPMPEPAPRNRP